MFFLFLLNLKSSAEHIVGGDVRLVYLGKGNEYKILLTLHFDGTNGTPAAVSSQNYIPINIYDKKTRKIVGSINLPKEQTYFPYQNASCQIGAKNIGIALFSEKITLDPNIYNSPDGYFMMWERCCRNYSIVNIYVNEAASAFYTEFPAITSNGAAFRNNSPDLGLHPRNTICINQTMNINFGGTDPDGDVLTYSLETPLNGFAYDVSQPPTPSTYPSTYPVVIPEVVWQPGYSANNAIKSNVGQPLSINTTSGLLTVNPNMLGVFVFSVKCEEFRNGKKIGELRRDFQFRVTICPANSPPTITVNTPQNVIYDSNTDMIINLEAKDTTCFKFTIKDTPTDIITEVKIVPISPNISNGDYSLNMANTTLNALGEVSGYICWNTCKLSRTKTERFIFDLQVVDNGCPNIGLGRKRITLYVKPKNDVIPTITIIGGSPNFNMATYEANIQLGEELRVDVEATDAYNRQITLSAIAIDDDFTKFGGSFTPKTDIGRVQSSFFIKTNCKDFDINKEIKLNIQFNVIQIGGCSPLSENLTIKVKIKDEKPDLSNFLPYNVFTPNGDAKNGYYALDNLPIGSCLYNFREFVVYNRWGQEVYQTNDRNFKWYAKNLPSGLYYYYLNYNNQKYKGYITVLY